jgi:hypothetical protein
MRLGIGCERHRNTKRDGRNKGRQNPLGRVVSGRDCDKPCNHGIPQRDAMNLPLFQLTEERAHFSPRRLPSIGYLGHHVEAGITRPSDS